MNFEICSRPRRGFWLLLLIIFPLTLLGQVNLSPGLNTKTTGFSEHIADAGQLSDSIGYRKIVIDGHTSRVPFYLFTNPNSNNYVLLLHGLGGSKMDWIYPAEPYFNYTRNLKHLKDSLLFLGYNVLIPDAKFHGERRYELDFRPIEKIPPLTGKTPGEGQIFNEMMEESIADFRLLIDYIQQKNAQAKFDIVGYSMGAAIALILNAKDHRISSVAACVPPLNHPAKEITGNNWPSDLKMDLINQSAYNHVADQTAPVALFMGKEDFFYTAEEVAQFYKKIPVENKQLKNYNSGHVLPDNFVKDVIGWIRSNTIN